MNMSLKSVKAAELVHNNLITKSSLKDLLLKIKSSPPKSHPLPYPSIKHLNHYRPLIA